MFGKLYLEAKRVVLSTNKKQLYKIVITNGVLNKNISGQTRYSEGQVGAKNYFGVVLRRNYQINLITYFICS